MIYEVVFQNALMTEPHVIASYSTREDAEKYLKELQEKEPDNLDWVADHFIREH